ncbi:MAG: response regulator [Melioribacteraceae bacterium]|nr:response regulator [Melioribacteraceae bacterium]
MIDNNKKIKILVVDDSDIIQESLKNLFENYSFEVYICADGLEGIKVATEMQPDLIFLDLMMPNLDGIKMLQVKKVIKDIEAIPVVVISANTARRNVLAAMEAGADKVISKPIKKEIVIKCVNEILGTDFHSNHTGVGTNISRDENNEIKDKLVEFFLNSFPAKKHKIMLALRSKDQAILKNVVHEIKGAGGTMGYPKLTELSAEIHDREINSATDWAFTEFKVNEISQLVMQIEENFKNKK